MVWMSLGGAARRTVSKAEVKNCPLCGTLNFYRNAECLACGWRGAFEQNVAAIDFHWQRLIERYEEVRLEHVLPRRMREIGDFGITRKTSLSQRLRAAWDWMHRALPARKSAPGISAARDAASPQTGNTYGQ